MRSSYRAGFCRMRNKNEFLIYFENGLPRATAQQKGERVILKNGGKPIILHYKKESVTTARAELMLKLKKYKPTAPSDCPIRLFLDLYFDVKDRRLWGKPKDTRPDADNYAKELIDAMTSCGFWKDDAQVVDLRIVKCYAETGAIHVKIEEVTDD